MIWHNCGHEHAGLQTRQRSYDLRKTFEVIHIQMNNKLLNTQMSIKKIKLILCNLTHTKVNT